LKTTNEQHDTKHTICPRECRKAGVTLNKKSKYEFTKRRVMFIGYIILVDGMRPDPDKTQVVPDNERANKHR